MGLISCGLNECMNGGLIDGIDYRLGTGLARCFTLGFVLDGYYWVVGAE